ncbi:hypothetical protein AB0C81_22365 [Streptomyces roseoverticillatus]|uniref:hypothetical protein n=1 Tax=Streptomyces roseoverticillatus TaxID=66429 RepID=UPI0033E8BCE0
MKIPWRIPWRIASVTAVAALFGGLFVHDVSSAEEAQVITCTHTWTMTFEPALTLTPQPSVTARIGSPNGALDNCTGDPAVTTADFVSAGVGKNVTCGAGTYSSRPEAANHATWNATSGTPAMDYSWSLQPVSDLLNVRTPLSGGITRGRYQGGTWTAVIDAARSTIPLADCSAPGGLKSLKVSGTLVITTPA